LKTSLFITFEGVEGCGKSTQSRRIYRRLERLAIPALLIHEPGITALGKKITRLLKWSQDIKISPLSELLLFNASRAQLLEEVVLPALNEGKIVICDRYADSSTAYQGYGRGLALEEVIAVNRTATQGLTPDLTVWLDVPVAGGLARKKDTAPDRFHREIIDFHRRVREGYRALAAGAPERWLTIDGTQNKDVIAGIIWQKVSQLLPRKRGV
jgi:dTMP kinase